VFGQPPRPDGATRVGRDGRRGVAGRLRDGPLPIGNVSQRHRPRRRRQVAGVARPTAGRLGQQQRSGARRRRVLRARAGARRRRSRPPAEHAVAARRQVGRAVDGRHGGARRRDELGAVGPAVELEQPLAAGAVLVAAEPGRRAAVADARRAARVAALRRRVARVVRAGTERALRPPIAPSKTRQTHNVTWIQLAVVRTRTVGGRTPPPKYVAQKFFREVLRVILHVS